MRAGRLNQRVTIQKAVEQLDEYGDLRRTWTDVAVVSASILHQSGKEFSKNSIDLSQTTASIRIRFRDWVDAKMRIVDGKNIWSIQAVLPDYTGADFLDLVCINGLDDGR